MPDILIDLHALAESVVFDCEHYLNKSMIDFWIEIYVQQTGRLTLGIKTLTMEIFIPDSQELLEPLKFSMFYSPALVLKPNDLVSVKSKFVSDIVHNDRNKIANIVSKLEQHKGELSFSPITFHCVTGISFRWPVS